MQIAIPTHIPAIYPDKFPDIYPGKYPDMYPGKYPDIYPGKYADKSRPYIFGVIPTYPAIISRLISGPNIPTYPDKYPDTYPSHISRQLCFPADWMQMRSYICFRRPGCKQLRRETAILISTSKLIPLKPLSTIVFCDNSWSFQGEVVSSIGSPWCRERRMSLGGMYT